MTKVDKITHLEKAQEIKPIQNLPTLIGKLKSTDVEQCKCCENSVDVNPKVTPYGVFCSNDCQQIHYDHFILPDVEAKREQHQEYLEYRREQLSCR